MPGKEWGKRYVKEIERSVSNLDRGLKTETKYASAALEDRNVLQTRFDQLNARKDALQERRDRRVDKIEDISDPDKWMNRIPVLRKINEARIRYHSKRERWTGARLARTEGRVFEAAGALKVAETRFSAHDANRLRYAQAITERLQRGTDAVDQRLQRIDAGIASLESHIARHDAVIADATSKVERIKNVRREARNQEEIQKLNTALRYFEEQKRASDAALRRLHSDLARSRTHRGRQEGINIMVQVGIDKVASKYDTNLMRRNAVDVNLDIPTLQRRSGSGESIPRQSASNLDLAALFSELFNENPSVADFIEHWNEMAIPGGEINDSNRDEFLEGLKAANPALNSIDATTSHEEWKKTLTELHRRQPRVIDNIRGSNTAEQFIDNFLAGLQLQAGTKSV